MSFTIEQMYGMTREQYCATFDVTPELLIASLEAEVCCLKLNLLNVSQQYRNGGLCTDDDQRERAKLIGAIVKKIDSKEYKIKDIQRNML